MSYRREFGWVEAAGKKTPVGFEPTNPKEQILSLPRLTTSLQYQTVFSDQKSLASFDLATSHFVDGYSSSELKGPNVSINNILLPDRHVTIVQCRDRTDDL